METTKNLVIRLNEDQIAAINNLTVEQREQIRKEASYLRKIRKLARKLAVVSRVNAVAFNNFATFLILGLVAGVISGYLMGDVQLYAVLGATIGAALGRFRLVVIAISSGNGKRVARAVGPKWVSVLKKVVFFPEKENETGQWVRPNVLIKYMKNKHRVTISSNELGRYLKKVGAVVKRPNGKASYFIELK